MADKKRKTLQIKRPDPNSVKSKKKPLPKVRMDEKAATSAVDTDELASMGPKVVKAKRSSDSKGKTTRIALPDEEKIRKARRANATQDLGAEDALPSAEQIAMAQKNATMPIMIDTESVEDNTAQSINDTEGNENMDRTMEIDAEALATGNLEKELQEAAQSQEEKDQTMKIDPAALATGNIEDALEEAGTSAEDQRDQTMQIDPDALATGNIGEALDEADTSAEDQRDQTMQIDPEALATGNIGEALGEADTSAEDQRDQTMQIDPEALATGNIGEVLESADTADSDQRDQTMKIDEDALSTGNLDEMLQDTEIPDTGDQTMQIDPESLVTGNVDPVNDEAIMSMETMQMEPIGDDLEAADETDLTVEEMKESFNAQTMEMDPSMLADELAKKSSGQFDDSGEDEDRSKTMDLSESRPKTIMIKRPSKKAPASSSTPTVKAVRPDAVTVRTSRPVTANTAQPKQDTSRIDIPGEESAGGGKEGKTIKLRRPSGAPASRSKASISRVASNAGLEVNEDGSVTSIPKAQEALGGGWVAVAVITFLISAGAAWTLWAQVNPETPMPGRLVDVNNQLIQRAP